MADRFEFISTTDKPALLAFSTPEWLEAARTALVELGYKVHTAATHGDFLVRFSQIQYQVVVVEELFAANNIGENLTLKSLQTMPMSQRRHATVLLVGNHFQTFSSAEAIPSRPLRRCRGSSKACMRSSTAPNYFCSSS